MNRSQLIERLSQEANLVPEDAENIVRTFFEEIKMALMEGRRVELRGFGSLTMRRYKSYTGHNPATGKCVTVSPKRLPYFRCGTALFDMLNPDQKQSKAQRDKNGKD